MRKHLTALLVTGLLVFGISMQTAVSQEPPEDLFMGPQHEMGGPEMGPGGPQGMQRFKNFKNKRGHHGGMARVFKELNLTEEQQAQLKQQKESIKSQMQGLRKQMQTERKNMFALMFDPDASKSQLYAQQEKVSALQDKMAKLRIDNIIKFKEVLTPEQTGKLHKIIEEKKKRFQSLREKRGKGFFNKGPQQ